MGQIYVLGVTDTDYIKVTGKWLGKNRQKCRVSADEKYEEKNGKEITDCYIFAWVWIRRNKVKWNNEVKTDKDDTKIMSVVLIESVVGGYNFSKTVLERLKEMARTEGRKLIIEDPIDTAMRYWCRPKIRVYLDTIMLQKDWEEKAKRIAKWSDVFIWKIKQCKKHNWKNKREWQIKAEINDEEEMSEEESEEEGRTEEES